LEVDTKSIDINIHPTKTEIKFDDEHTIYAMLRATIKHSLGQFSISPALDFNKDSEFETPYSYSKKAPISPIIEVDSDYNPFKKESSQSKISFPFKREKNSSWESLYIGLNQDSGETDTLLGNIEFESEEVTGSLFESETESVGQITFQMYNKYIVCPIKSSLMIIHQNLAHQRVLYEEILKNITVKEAVSQQLLFPIQLEFSTPDLEIIEKIKEQLENTGFIFSAFGESKVEIEGIPATINEGQVKDVLEQLINDVKEEVPDAGFSQNDLLAKSLAKSMSIKTGASLNNKEQEHLVNQLFACKEPMVSPSNKPIFVTLNVADFDKKFM
jgi:DNA mismatch repair protein MutL